MTILPTMISAKHNRMKNKIAIIGVALISALSVSPAFSATKTYLPGFTGDWFADINWNPNHPVAGDDVFVGGLSFPVLSVSTAGAQATNLTAYDSGTVVVSGTGTLDLTGALKVGLSGSPGNFNITGGGVVTAADTQVGTGTGIGFVSIDGAGSKLETTQITIGKDRIGIFSVMDGGELSVNSGAGTVNVGSATATGTLNVGTGTAHGVVSAAGIALDGSSSVNFNFTDNYTYGGIISGAGSVGKSGIGGILTLSGANTYTEGTAINSGIIVVDNANGSTSSSVGTGQVVLNGGIFLSGAANLNFANSFFAGTNGGIVDNGSNTLTLSGDVTGTGAIGFAGSGITILSYANTNTGGLLALAGVLAISDEAALGSGTFTIYGGGTLRADTANMVIANNMSMDNSISGNRIINTNGNNLQLDGLISGSGNWQKNGTGELTLNHANTSSGTFTVNGGSIKLNNQAGFGTGDVSLHGGSKLTFNASNMNVQNNIELSLVGGFTHELDTQANTVTLSGIVSGDAVMQKTGAGTLVLNNTNTYTGGTTVGDGTVELKNASGFGTELVVMDGGTVLRAGANNMVVANDFLAGCSCSDAVFDTQAFNMTMTGGLFIDSYVNKTGSGRLTFNGDGSTFRGRITVSDGTFQIGDDTHGSVTLGDGTGSALVDANGTLSGHGTFGGNIINSGTVSPGGSIGTLTVTGNYAQVTTANLAISVSPAASSVLAVQGIASISGGLRVTFEPGVYAPKTYTFLTAAGGVNGIFTDPQFAPVPAGADGVELTASAPIYTANSVSFMLSGLVRSTPGNTGAAIVPSVASSVITASPSVALRVFDAAQFALGADLVTVDAPGMNALAFSNLGTSRMVNAENAAGINDLAKSLPNVMKDKGGWFKAYGNLGAVSSDSARPGFRSESGGFLFGGDKAISKTFKLGAAGGYERTMINSFTAGKNEGRVNSMRFAIYGRQIVFDDIALDGQAGYALHMIDIARYVAAAGGDATSSHNAHEFSGTVQASKKFDTSSGFKLVPQAGMHFTYLYEEGFTESGARAFNATFADKNTNSLKWFTGFMAVAPLQKVQGYFVSPEAHVRYTYESLNNASTSTGTVGAAAFTVTGVTPSSHVLSAGTSVKAKLDDKVDAFISYDANLPTSNIFSQTFGLGVKVKF